MKKETLIKLLILFRIPDNTIRYCSHIPVTPAELDAMKYYLLKVKNGRLDL